MMSHKDNIYFIFCYGGVYMVKKNRVLSENVADEILSMINVEKRFVPGSRLPNETDFSSELNVSRTTFREAVRMLVDRGVSIIKRGNGTFVSDDYNFSDDFGITKCVKKGIAERELNEIRLFIEPEAAYLAAIRATESEIKRMCTFCENLDQVMKNGTTAERQRAEQKFHLSIANSVHNEFMDKLMPVLFTAIGQTMPMLVKDDEFCRKGAEDHKAIIDRIKKRDADGARTIMRFHILRGIMILEGKNCD